MNFIAILDLIGAVASFAALAAALSVSRNRLGISAKLFLCLTLLTCVFSGFANVLEHTGVTDRLDVYEDYSEILFVPFSLCFIYAYWTREELLRRKRVEDAFSHERYLLHAIMDSTPDAIYFKDTESRFSRISKGVAERFGLSDPAEAIGRTDFDFFTDEHAREAFEDEREVMRTGEPIVGKEEKETWPDGATTWASTTKMPLRDEEGGLVGTFGISRDITERRNMEAQLRQAQKMEAVGQLAGGIAHDFNNQLTVVRGYCDLLLADPELSDDLRDSLREIRNAAERARKLTSHLLALGRRQPLRLKAVNLNETVERMAEPLARMIGENIRLSIEAEEHLGSVMTDPDQAEQALMNLVVNARDAMPDGGELTIETANVELGADFAAAHPGASTGPHVRLSVRDTGTGMDEATKDRIFEPFFTTKPAAHGTGLGLLMVYGFVRQSGGQIDVTSAKGEGTTVRIHLPRVEAAPLPPPAAEAPAPARAGSETVLVAEDDRSVREFLTHMLRENGYTVLDCGDPVKCLALAEQHAGRIDLLVTDVVMPGMNGPELAKRLAAAGLAMPVLYVSGYADPDIGRSIAGVAVTGFLSKPFGPEALLGKVRQLLDEPAST
jgi:two-component system cell cycle sensor histidine kinase/response regulator CckA